jgi:hypothetical protein
MPALDPGLIALIIILVIVGSGTTWWIFHRRRGIDRAGLMKGTARDTSEVRRQNPPER